jgi:peptide deformylase
MTIPITTTNSQHSDVLARESHSVQFPLNEEIKEVVRKIKVKLTELGGVGLAAPQIGEPFKIFGVYIQENAAGIRLHGRTWPLTIYFNASYEPAPGSEVVTDWEACYSVQNFMGLVPRHSKIIVTAQDETGRKSSFEVAHHLARVFQHEIDHTFGTLFKDRLTKDSLSGTIEEMEPIRVKGFTPGQRALYDSFMQNKR